MTGLNPTEAARILKAVASADPGTGNLITAFHVRSRPGSLVRRVCTLGGALSVGALLLFHAVIFYGHLLDGRLFEPGVALRWAIGAVLLALIVALRRVGVPLLWGRRALVVWVLVVLLHVSAARPASFGSLTTAAPEDAALALFVVPSAGAAIVVAAGLLLLGAWLVRRLAAPAITLWTLAIDSGERSSSRLFSPILASRAPPLRCC